MGSETIVLSSQMTNGNNVSISLITKSLHYTFFFPYEQTQAQLWF